MERLILIAIIFYILSTAGYVVYLFLQKNYLQQSGYYLLAAGFLFHTLAIAYGFAQLGHLPVTNLFETLSVACWAIAGVFLIFQFKFKLKVLGIFAAPLIAVTMIVAFRPASTSITGKSSWAMSR